MAKAYWVVTYRKIKDPEKLAAYAKLAGPAIQSMGGKAPSAGTLRIRGGFGAFAFLWASPELRVPSVRGAHKQFL